LGRWNRFAEKLNLCYTGTSRNPSAETEDFLGNRKTLQELTIKDNFMFAAVMMEEDNCRCLLELVLEMPIERVEISREKSIVYNPEYKGVRLDIFAKDERHTHYNVEMQVQHQNLEKRSRYYHSQMDMELLAGGTAYESLPDAYVIFICDFDPFGAEKYRYTVKKHLKEAADREYQDGLHSIFLSTKGKNKSEVPKALVKFLQFVQADSDESKEDFEDEFVKKLQASIARIKTSREMGARYMVFEELLREEYTAGKAEGKLEERTESILELLEDLGTVEEELRCRLMAIKDLDVLKKLHHAAARANSVQQFEEFLNTL
jgi:predicted transposase/invertase (TIGR01784 family)